MNYGLQGEETQRLRFRPLAPTDFAAWLPFHQDPRSSQYWEGLPQDPVTACQQQFERTFERYAKGLGGLHALTLKENGNLVGLAGPLLQVVDGAKELEVAYSILPQYWQKGLATEAATKCKEVAFSRQWWPSLISIIQIHNLPSQKVALKNGMRLDGTTRYKGNPVHIYRINTPLPC
ncbi:GNAT family N-acetyltransferase [Maribacter sp. 2307ULW6-5]|uniref:GNAT family N-acetyltransferase n=1 Tax=Maribacter sp. 2307ULW6-5 TaxID=3386275 RepID=UPI0039BCA585